MANLVVERSFRFDARYFDFESVYRRGFATYDQGVISDRTISTGSDPFGQAVTASFRMTLTTPDGVTSEIGVSDSTYTPYVGAPTRVVGIYYVSVSSGGSLLYTLADYLDQAQRESPRHTTAAFYAGENRISVGAADAYILGGFARDFLYANTGANYLAGQGGNDVLVGGVGPDHLDGGDGADSLSGGAGDDFLQGGVGNDRLQGGQGADVLDGGEGIDTVDYGITSSGVTANLADSSQNTGAAAGDVYRSIENLYGTRGDDVLTGDAGDNIIHGMSGGLDILFGGAGNDSLYKEFGVSRLHGGDGDDYLYAERLPARFFTSNDPNLLFGGAGNDRLVNAVGFSFLDGGAGADQLVGGDEFDWATYENSPNGLRISMIDPLQSTGEASGDVFTRIDGVRGSGHDDVLIGTLYAQVFAGGAGNDMLVGGGGSDQLYGGAGDDTYFIPDALIATVIEGVDEGYDRVYAGASFVLPDNVEALVLQGGGVTGIGNAGRNYIIGNELWNVLSGGAGDDNLLGRGGKETFVFRAGYGRDTIDDFEGAGVTDADVVQIDPALADDFGALSALGRQVGDDALFVFDASTALIFRSVTLTSLHATDFVFV